MLKKILFAAALLATATSIRADPVMPFEINMQRVETMAPKKCGVTTTYIIPSLYLFIEARSTTSSRNGGASTKARVFVEGLDKALLQALAKNVYDDLIAKMRAAGYTVLTYDDIKSDVAAFGRMDPNPKYGMPTRHINLNTAIDWVVAAPSDEQAIGHGVTGPTFAYRPLARARNATVFVPEIYFTLPQAGAAQSSTYTTREASVSFDPAMKLYAANMYGMPPDWSWCNVLVKEHGMRLAAPVAGRIQQLSQDEMNFDTWSRTTGDFAFVLDRAAFSEGILRVGYAFNGLITGTAQKAH
jgi:hypothetical protein